MQRSGIDEIYNGFLNIVKTKISFCIPSKFVSIGPRNPSFISPVIKGLFVKRNRLRRKGRVEEANLLADRINTHIVESRSVRFVKLAHANSKDLWQAVKGKDNRSASARARYGILLSHPDLVNRFFATIANSDDYRPTDIAELRNVITSDDLQQLERFSITEIDIEPYLRKLKNTAPDNDNIPVWVFRMCSYELVPGAAAISPPPPVIFSQVAASRFRGAPPPPPVIFASRRSRHTVWRTTINYHVRKR
jgi:hypothetical protein